MTTPIFNQSVSIFDTSTADPAGILPLQTQTGGPEVSGVERATNMLIPDSPTSTQLRNFPEDLYDLRDTSVLVRMMKVLLGDAGVGQLRKRALVTRLESYLTGANFFDLDRFYGAIFGALRNPAETLTINPMADTATPDEWDALMAADASYRERISALARAINLGGTVPSLKQAAEAIVQAPVDVYESWQLLDAYSAFLNPDPATWDEVQSTHGSWNLFLSTDTWNSVEGAITVGRTNTLSRSEIVIRPKKDYANTATHAYDFPQDENALVRVLQHLRPAGTIITVDPTVGNPHRLTPISGLRADSEFWEVVRKVLPKTTLNGGAPVYPLSAGQVASGVAYGDRRVMPRPPFSSGTGRSWTYNTLLGGAKSYIFPASDPNNLTEPQDGTPSAVSDDQTVVYRDGQSIQYTAQKGVLDPQQILASATVADGALVAHPYTGDRKAVLSHD
jgi:hypothetical protein